MSNSHTRIGKAQVDIAHAGKDQFGRKLSMKDRKKIIMAGRDNLVEGMKRAADKKAGITRNK